MICRDEDVAGSEITASGYDPTSSQNMRTEPLSPENVNAALVALSVNRLATRSVVSFATTALPFLTPRRSRRASCCSRGGDRLVGPLTQGAGRHDMINVCASHIVGKDQKRPLRDRDLGQT